MDNLIEMLRNSSTTMQAVAVSIGGLIGVFATLGFFWFLIWFAGKIGKGGKESKA
ncbi:MAG: hypothetical protein LLF89_05700 [Spirochaetaceae bacterium]|nr:hypothetical protein [Spirochaetaceae bacterium]